MANTLNTAPRAGAELPFRLLDTSAAAAALGIGRRTLQEKMESREIGFVRIGRAVRFRPEDVQDFIERNRQKALGWKGGRQ
ncbi:MAG: helix-turn-helix domain-containing protein [Luteolibacter sp.]